MNSLRARIELAGEVLIPCWLEQDRAVNAQYEAVPVTRQVSGTDALHSWDNRRGGGVPANSVVMMPIRIMVWAAFLASGAECLRRH